MISRTSKLYSETRKYVENWIEHIERTYLKRKRKISINAMMRILISLTMEKSSSYSKVFIDDDDLEFTFNKSSFSKFRNKIPSNEFKQLFLGYLKVLEKLKIFDSEKRIIAIDGSKIQLDIRMIREGYSPIVHFPQGLLGSALDVTTGIPLINELTNNKNERKLLDNFIDRLPKGSVILLDRGFFSDYLFCKCVQNRLIPIFRLKSDLLCVKALTNSNLNELNTTLKGNVSMRVIKYRINKTDYYIGTSSDATIDEIKELYHIRWSIEEFFKLLKVNSNFGKLHSTSENGVKQELYLHMFLIAFEKALSHINRDLLVVDDLQKSKNIKKNFNNNAVLLMVKKQIRKMCSGTFKLKHEISIISKKLLANIEITKKLRDYPRLVKGYTSKEKYNISTRRRNRKS